VRWQAPRRPLPPREVPRVRRDFREGSEDSGWEAAAGAGQAPPVPQAETHFPADLTLGSRARPGLLPGRPAHRVATLLAVLEEHSAAALPARETGSAAGEQVVLRGALRLAAAVPLVAAVHSAHLRRRLPARLLRLREQELAGALLQELATMVPELRPTSGPWGGAAEVSEVSVVSAAVSAPTLDSGAPQR
jgi:hypothetical protein